MRGKGAEHREMEKNSLPATEPSRKTLNRDKPLDREARRWEKHQQAPGQRRENSKILPGSQRQTAKKEETRDYRANTGTGNCSSKMKKGDTRESK